MSRRFAGAGLLRRPGTRFTVGGGGAPGYDPLTALPNLRLAVDASVGVTLVGADVSAWADQSGVGNNLACPNRPLFVATGFNGGSEPFLQFDGVNDYATDTTFSWGVATLDTYSVLIVAQIVTVVSGRIWWQYAGTGAAPYGQLLVSPDRSSFVSRSSGGTLTTPENLTPQAFQFICDGGVLATYRRGNTVVGPTAIASTTHSDNLAFTLGSLAAGAAATNVRIAAAYVCRAALTTQEQDDFYAYATSRWGV
jgi:hypothetical protein